MTNSVFRNLSEVLKVVRSGFYNRRVLVVGDIMLDRYLWGDVERISPEAPVPVVRLHHTTDTAGGAANVAMNLRELGCEVCLAGVIGTDENGRRLLELLNHSGVETSLIVSVPEVRTTSKTRILGGQQQMLRLDEEKAGVIPAQFRNQFLSRIEAQIPSVSAIVLSDYKKGVLEDSICRAIILRGRELSIPIFIDPKGLDFTKYAGCTVLSPNRMELAAATSSDSTNLDMVLEAGEHLRSELGVGHLLVTLGELGMALLGRDSIRHFSAQAREVFDVSGAGDTVIATLCAGAAAGLSLEEAIQLANLAAGVVVGKLGTVPISKNELVAVLCPDGDTGPTEKISTRQELEERVVRWRVAGKRIVFTNGCFDLLHVGHLALLEQAKQQGDCLVVALNTDRSVRALKGPGRPIISEDARARLLAALPCVDAVVLFDEETPTSLIERVQPNVLVKGGNYLEDEVVGAGQMKSWGGKVVLIPLVEGFKTAAILRRAIAGVHEDPPRLIQ